MKDFSPFVSSSLEVIARTRNGRQLIHIKSELHDSYSMIHRLGSVDYQKAFENGRYLALVYM